MSKSDPFATLLYWLMVASGGAVLAACVVLPPWVEHIAAREQLAQAEARLDALQRRSVTLAAQIEHLQHDEAYLLRLERGENANWAPASAPSTDRSATESDAASDPVQELSDLIGAFVRRYPFVGLFVVERTRPAIMALAAAQILAALVLLCRRPTGAATV